MRAMRTLIVSITLLLLVPSATLAQDIVFRGVDIYATLVVTVRLDLPTDFFDPGSDPFSGFVGVARVVPEVGFWCQRLTVLR